MNWIDGIMLPLVSAAVNGVAYLGWRYVSQARVVQAERRMVSLREIQLAMLSRNVRLIPVMGVVHAH